ncbi:MAG TPA: DUF305 domain-containing protein [Pyrinomonadaceae bacterium]|nr:DUF305 domain-containing protein [Pyrinomonadaceae bacterium]
MKNEHEDMKHENMKHEKGMMTNHYLIFLLMIVLMFISMYVLMYAMVNSFANVFSNYNQFYMAGLMTAPMVIIEMVLMGGMYRNKKLNLAIIGVSVIALLGFWFLIREQTAINDRQFLKSMIPHHAGAILMCQEAELTDPEIKQLCGEIIKAQEIEIQQMKEKLSRLER